MINYRVKWTDAQGVPRSSVVAYCRSSALDRKRSLESAKENDVRVVREVPRKHTR